MIAYQPWLNSGLTFANGINQVKPTSKQIENICLMVSPNSIKVKFLPG